MNELKDNTVIPTSEDECKKLAKWHEDNRWMFYQKNNRPEYVIRKNVYDGKYAELMIAYKANKTTHKITRGVDIYSETPDDGTDLIIDDKHIQVKNAPTKYFNIRNHDILTKLKKYTGLILVYSQEQDKVFQCTQTMLNDDIRISKFEEGYYIFVSKLIPYNL